MPRAASICLVGGCTSKSAYRGRCVTHAPPAWETKSARNRLRPSAWQRVIRPRALVRDRFACVACGSRTELEVDHVVPIAQGGTWTLDNAQTLCRSCHQEKTLQDRRKS